MKTTGRVGSAGIARKPVAVESGAATRLALNLLSATRGLSSGLEETP
jgi:hypothetical protein